MNVKDDTLIVVFYADDFVLTRNKPNIMYGLKNQLATRFEMIDLGILHFFLGLQVLPLLDGLFISKYKYVLDLLKCFKMDNHKDCATPYQSSVK